MADRPSTSRPAPDLVEDGVPATTDAPPGLDVDATEGEPAPLDHPQGVDAWGVTAAEQATDEPLRVRTAHEQPDVPTVGDDGEGGEALGLENQAAEEAALRVADDAPGGSWAPDPGYVSDGE